MKVRKGGWEEGGEERKGRRGCVGKQRKTEIEVAEASVRDCCRRINLTRALCWPDLHTSQATGDGLVRLPDLVLAST